MSVKNTIENYRLENWILVPEASAPSQLNNLNNPGLWWLINIIKQNTSLIQFWEALSLKEYITNNRAFRDEMYEFLKTWWVIVKVNSAVSALVWVNWEYFMYGEDSSVLIWLKKDNQYSTMLEALAKDYSKYQAWQINL